MYDRHILSKTSSKSSPRYELAPLEGEMMAEDYRQFVETRVTYNPCLSTLSAFLSSTKSQKNSIRMASLDFYGGETRPVERKFSVAELPSLLGGFRHCTSPRGSDTLCTKVGNNTLEDDHLYLRMLIVEDLTKDVVEKLGYFLDIDPIFFASHIHGPWTDTGAQNPNLAILPSKTKPHNYINIHHHRVITFKDVPQPPRKLLRMGNLERKVVVFPLHSNVYVGLAQHTTSILYVKGIDFDIGIILVDPPVTDRYLYDDRVNKNLKEIILPTEFFLNGYESFEDSPSVYHEISSQVHPDRKSLLDDLIYYWASNPRHLFRQNGHWLGALSYFPLRIVAAEWVNYISVMHRSIKNYEYITHGQTTFLNQLNKLNNDLRALQSWRRRSISSQRKIRSAIYHVRNWHVADEGGGEIFNALLIDYAELLSSIDEFGRTLENMLPIVTSLVQVVDSQRSYAETANVTRLTILALFFVPLTYIASLFSMNPDHGPGGPYFWVYFAVAIPVTAFVILIARLPFLELGWLLDYLNFSKQVLSPATHESISSSKVFSLPDLKRFNYGNRRERNKGIHHVATQRV